MSAEPTILNTCAVIVTFHPGEGFSDCLERVRSQFPLVIIVDNGSPSPVVPTNQGGFLNWRLIANRTNLGIAAALNQGVNLAILEGFKWVVTLDQDTMPVTDMLESLIDVYQKCGGGDVMIGSNYWDVHRRRNFIRCSKSGTDFKERTTLITSGTLASASLFERIGSLREDYFIDSVDHEFCLRARAHGFRIIICCRAVMGQSIGVPVKNASGLSRFMSFNHAPARKYYIARNAISTVKLYFFQEPMWSMRQGWRLLFEFLSILIFENYKIKKTQAFLVGIAHGITGKMGSIDKAWPDGLR